MLHLPFVGVALLMGAAITVQPLLNASLRGQLGMAPQLILSNLIVLILSVPAGLAFQEAANWDKVLQVPPYLWGGALCGMIILVGGVVVFPRLGPAASLGLILLGQMALGLLFEHFGWLGAAKNPISMVRLAGVALLAAGAFLLLRGGGSQE